MLLKIIFYKKIRTYLLISLVFSFLCVGCSDNEKEIQSVSIKWENEKAVAITIPLSLLKNISPDSARQLLHVQLENTGVDMLGDYSSASNAITFKPVVPFTRGLKYEVYAAGKPITSLQIPANSTSAPPSLIAVYPSGNKVPENLLKMYIVFSKPMQEGQAMENIVMIRNKTDTVSVFLDLQQELWNKERTILTLWLDPGRIKRGLQPNERSGNPLQQGQDYRLYVKPGWRDTEGQILPFIYSQSITVGSRDSLSPVIDQWEIISPKAGSHDALKIKLHEQLDYLLLKNTISIVDNSGNPIDGRIEVQASETGISFTPTAEWKTGNYTLEVEARLEDLAGNNLNRLFDEDISKKKNIETKSVYKRSFRID